MIFQPAAQQLSVQNPRPYDLRHSLASLLFAEGRNPAEIAEFMGHTLQALLSTYTHVIVELRGAERRDAEDLIKEARKPGGHILVRHESIVAQPVEEKMP